MEQFPHDAFTRAASLSLFFFIIAINVLWLVVKLVLWKNGHGVWFALRMDDLGKLKSLATGEPDAAKRRRYQILRNALQLCWSLVFIVPLLLLAVGALVSHTRH